MSQTLHYCSFPFPYFCHHHHHHHHAIVLASFTVLIYVLRSQQSRDDVTDVSMTTRTDRAPGCSSEDGRVLIGNVQRDVPIVWIGGVPRSGTTLMRDPCVCMYVCLSVRVSVLLSPSGRPGRTLLLQEGLRCGLATSAADHAPRSLVCLPIASRTDDVGIRRPRRLSPSYLSVYRTRHSG